MPKPYLVRSSTRLRAPWCAPLDAYSVNGKLPACPHACAPNCPRLGVLQHNCSPLEPPAHPHARLRSLGCLVVCLSILHPLLCTCALSCASLCSPCHGHALVLRTSCSARPCAPCYCLLDTRLLVPLLGLAIRAPDYPLMPFAVELLSSPYVFGIGTAKSSAHTNPNI